MIRCKLLFFSTCPPLYQGKLVGWWSATNKKSNSINIRNRDAQIGAATVRFQDLPLAIFAFSMQERQGMILCESTIERCTSADSFKVFHAQPISFFSEAVKTKTHSNHNPSSLISPSWDAVSFTIVETRFLFVDWPGVFQVPKLAR